MTGKQLPDDLFYDLIQTNRKLRSAVMKTCRLISILLLIMVLLLSGCGSADHPEGAVPSDAGSAGAETALPAPEPEEPYAFNPHLYSPMLSKYYPQEWWDSL